MINLHSYHFPVLKPQMVDTIGGYGVTWVGEEGNMLILGRPSILRAAAIFLAFGKRQGLTREEVGFSNPLSDSDLTIDYRAARFTGPTQTTGDWQCDYSAGDIRIGYLSPVTVMLV